MLDVGGVFYETCGKWLTSGGNREYNFEINTSNVIVFQVTSDGTNGTKSTATWGTALVVGRWYYVVGYHDATNDIIGISINAETAVETAHTTGVYDGTSAFVVGDYGSFTQPLDGRIMLVSFWDKVLTDAQVTRQYNEGRALAFKDWNTDDKTSLVAHWPCNEPSGTRKDISGNGHDLIDNNTVTQALGVSPSARQYTRANSEYHSRADTAALRGSDKDFSFVTMFRLDSVGIYHELFGKYVSSGNQREYLVEIRDTDDLSWIVSSTGASGGAKTTVDWPTPVVANQWYFLYVYHDAANDEIGIRVDDAAITTAAHTGGVFGGTAAFTVGSWGGLTEFLDGRQQFLRMYDRLLTDDEVDAHFNHGQGLTDDELTGSLRDQLLLSFDLGEKSGQATDQSGNDYHLNDNATVTWAAGVDRGLSLGDEETVAAGAAIVGAQGADFESANSEALVMPDIDALSRGDTDFSAVVMVNVESLAADQTFLGKWTTAGNQREYKIGYDNTADRFRFTVSNNGTAEVSVNADTLGSPSTGTDYVITVYHDAANNEIGIDVNNGGFDTAAHTTGVFQGTSDFVIGATGDLADFADGVLDGAAMWSKILSATEITEVNIPREAPY
jgi:hypothetical protein